MNLTILCVYLYVYIHKHTRFAAHCNLIYCGLSPRAAMRISTRSFLQVPSLSPAPIRIACARPGKPCMPGPRSQDNALVRISIPRRCSRIKQTNSKPSGKTWKDCRSEAFRRILEFMAVPHASLQTGKYDEQVYTQ